MARAEHRDFTIGRLGIRVYSRYCVMIEKVSAMSGWSEDGRLIHLPVTEEFLSAQRRSSAFLLVLTSYERAYPGDGLLELLKTRPGVPAIVRAVQAKPPTAANLAFMRI